MFSSYWKELRKVVAGSALKSTVFVIVASLVLSPVSSQAQTVLGLPVPGTMVTPSAEYVPTIVSGITIHPEHPLKLDFIINAGDSGLSLQSAGFKAESEKLVKYFLAALTVPEEDLWVNLSPYEKERMTSKGLGETEMGRDLLAQDYMLKQLTASLIYPETELGDKFWQTVRQKIAQKYGNINVPLDTFNKVWIVPQNAVVYEQDNSVFVVEKHLKVMLAEDYLAIQNNTEAGAAVKLAGTPAAEHEIASEVVREMIIPAIEKEVNEGANFASLRQIYNSMILAVWYKKSLKESLLGQVYSDKNKTNGVDQRDKATNQKIYQQYMEAFKVGAYKYIKEEYDPVTQNVVPRKYFSGGFSAMDNAMSLENKLTIISKNASLNDKAMAVTKLSQSLPGAGNVVVELVDATPAQAMAFVDKAQRLQLSSLIKSTTFVTIASLLGASILSQGDSWVKNIQSPNLKVVKVIQPKANEPVVVNTKQLKFSKAVIPQEPEQKDISSQALPLESFSFAIPASDDPEVPSTISLQKDVFSMTFAGAVVRMTYNLKTKAIDMGDGNTRTPASPGYRQDLTKAIQGMFAAVLNTSHPQTIAEKLHFHSFLGAVIAVMVRDIAVVDANLPIMDWATQLQPYTMTIGQIAVLRTPNTLEITDNTIKQMIIINTLNGSISQYNTSNGELMGQFAPDNDQNPELSLNYAVKLLQAMGSGLGMTQQDYYYGVNVTNSLRTWLSRLGISSFEGVANLPALTTFWGDPLMPSISIYVRDGKLVVPAFGGQEASFGGIELDPILGTIKIRQTAKVLDMGTSEFVAAIYNSLDIINQLLAQAPAGLNDANVLNNLKVVMDYMDSVVVQSEAYRIYSGAETLQPYELTLNAISVKVAKNMIQITDATVGIKRMYTINTLTGEITEYNMESGEPVVIGVYGLKDPKNAEVLAKVGQTLIKETVYETNYYDYFYLLGLNNVIRNASMRMGFVGLSGAEKLPSSAQYLTAPGSDPILLQKTEDGYVQINRSGNKYAGREGLQIDTTIALVKNLGDGSVWSMGDPEIAPYIYAEIDILENNLNNAPAGLNTPEELQKIKAYEAFMKQVAEQSEAMIKVQFDHPDGQMAPIQLVPSVDQAQKPVGGIDLNAARMNFQIKRDGRGVPLPVFQQPLGTLQINGLAPVILNISPVNVPLLLGLKGQGKASTDQQISFRSLDPMDEVSQIDS